MDDMASVFRNNTILPRKDQPTAGNMVTIFEDAGRGDAVVNIEGYAIIPLDVYHALRAQMTEHQFNQLLQTMPSQTDASYVGRKGIAPGSLWWSDRVNNVTLERSS